MSLKGETQAVLTLQDIVSCDMNRAKKEQRDLFYPKIEDLGWYAIKLALVPIIAPSPDHVLMVKRRLTICVTFSWLVARAAILCWTRRRQVPS